MKLASDVINRYKHITNIEAIDLCNNMNKLQILFITNLVEYSSSKSRSHIDRFTR